MVGKGAFQSWGEITDPYCAIVSEDEDDGVDEERRKDGREEGEGGRCGDQAGDDERRVRAETSEDQDPPHRWVETPAAVRKKGVKH